MTPLEQQELQASVTQYAATAYQLGTTAKGLFDLFKKKKPTAAANPAIMKAEFTKFVEAEIAKRDAANPSPSIASDKSKTILYVVGGVVGVSLVGLVIYLLVKNKK